MPSEQHHYVPKFLLKHFTKGKKAQIFVYDKSNDNQFRTHIKNIASEKGFYDIEVDNAVLTLEPGLAHLESNAAVIIKKIIKNKSLQILNENDIAIIAVFLAVQFVRTKEHRLRFEKIGELFTKKLKNIGASDENIEELFKDTTGLAQDKVMGIKSILGSNEFVPHFLNKEWVLFETSSKYPFYISDNPVTLHNEIDYGFYGNLGLAVKGIEIYLPISTTLCLALLCPSIAIEFQKAYEEIKLLDQTSPGLADVGMNHPKETRAFCEGLVKKTPIMMVEDNITMLNSLQVTYSSRFIYCETNTFDLVKKMISKNELYREGHKPTVS